MIRSIIKYIIIFSSTILFSNCEKILEEKMYSDLAESNFLTTETGIQMVLNAAYDNIQMHGQNMEYRMLHDVFTSGIGWGKGGSMERDDGVPFRNFSWNSNSPKFQYFWTALYLAIRNSNIVLDNIDNEKFSDDFKIRITAEAKAIRGFSYVLIHSFWGTAPLFTTAKTTDFRLSRATESEIHNQIEKDLSEAIEVLPVEQSQYGRFTKGAVMGILCKYYLNTKQWQKCSDMALEIIGLNKYELLPNYADIFNITNEGNNELLWIHPSLISPASVGNNITALTLPLDYPLLSNQGNYAATVYFFDSFIDAFDATDTRKDLFITQYVNKSNILVIGYGNNMSLQNKYAPDPNGMGSCNGVDLIEIRYADILLSLAEALNEMDGPSQQIIDLINQIRFRANVSLIELANFDKDSLRDFIFNERRLELYFEAKEREDLIRQGKFISNAKAWAILADDHHVLYPIPQRELDANPNLEQNPGYN